ncbi:MAG: GbsR/MarR family transcriptional regulator [Bdellovibrionales bacterium]
MKSQTKPELCVLAEEIGKFIQYWGFKKIHGQIWALVFLSEKPLNSTYMTKKLRVSKALVSLAIKDLLNYKVLEIVEKKNKEIYFQSNPDIFSVINNVLKNRESKMLESIREKYETVAAQDPSLNQDYELSQSRLGEMGFMIMAAQETLKSMIANGFNEVPQTPADEN